MSAAAGRLAGSVVLVTGGGRGIGRALVEGLAADGASVGLCARDSAAVADVERVVTDAGGRAVGASGDVTDADDVHRIVSTVTERLGPIDTVVCNAGVIDPQETDPWAVDVDAWWRVVEVNLLGVQRVLAAVVPGMVERGHGRIVEMTSGMAVRDVPDYSAYSTSKTALLRLSGAYAAAGADAGLRVFDIAPGVVRTDMTRSMAVMSDRTEWTPPEAVVALVAAAAAGDLDHLSGRFLRAGVDDPDALRGPLATRFADDPAARRLALRPYAADDPLS
jgi:NAD(P)-dependent dehydrogenase (short-subunit alcohol dehydrogenase family)